MLMKNYIVLADLKSPEVIFLNNGVFMISGSSRPENTVNFFRPLEAWINEFKNTDPKQINFTVDLDYINSSSVKFLITIMKQMKVIANNQIPFVINWVYEHDDLDTLDLGKELEKSLGSPFTFQSKT
jgi:hypothetical protein